MDSRSKPPSATPLIERIAEPPDRPAMAVTRRVSYRSLLMRNAAVWKRGSRVWFSTAGDNPTVHRLSCASGQAARQLAMSFTTELRKARSDDEYNAIVLRVLSEIRAAWPDNVKVRHVHSCNSAVPGKVNAAGLCDCGFDWTQHEQTTDCPCVVEIDNSDETGEWQFVVHRTGWKRKEMVSV